MRAHHGSVSREQRTLIEEPLKAGRSSTARLQLARAGHRHGLGRSRRAGESPNRSHAGSSGSVARGTGGGAEGRISPSTAATCSNVRCYEGDARGQIEERGSPETRSMCSPSSSWRLRVDDRRSPSSRRSWPRASPTRGSRATRLESVLDMLAGRYPSDEFADLRPR